MKLAIWDGRTPAKMPGDEEPTKPVPCPQCGWIRRFTDKEIEAFKDRPKKKFCQRCLDPVPTEKKKAKPIPLSLGTDPDNEAADDHTPETRPTVSLPEDANRHKDHL